jgi:hypothetical protein
MTIPKWEEFLSGSAKEPEAITCKDVFALFDPEGDNPDVIRVPGHIRKYGKSLHESKMRRGELPGVQDLLKEMGLPESATALPATIEDFRPGEFNLPEWQNGMMDQCRELFMEDGYSAPMIHIAFKGEDGAIGVMHMSLVALHDKGYSNDIKASFARDVLSPLMKKFNAFCYITTAEAWARVGKVDPNHVGDIDALDGYESVKDHPDSIEVIHMHVETKTGSKMMMTRILRDAEGNHSLSDEDEDMNPDGGLPEGPLVGLLLMQNMAEA